MSIFKKRPPVISLGDEVRVKAMGRTYSLRLSQVDVDFHRGASATLRDHSHFMTESLWGRK